MEGDSNTGRGHDGATLSRVRAVSRAVAILRCFGADRMRLTLSDISVGAKLDAGTARRLLVTLRDEGLVAQDSGTGRYHLTLQMARFAAAVPEGQSLKHLAEVDMRALAEQTGLTVLLSALSDSKAVCLAREHGNAPVQVRWWPVGEALPMNCGAAPRLLLAHMPASEREAVLEGRLVALTRHSVTNPVALREMLERARAEGWAMAVNDVIEGLSALAAPVYGPAGEVAGAVSIGGLTPMIVSDRGAPRAEPLSALRAATKRISARLQSDYFTE